MDARAAGLTDWDEGADRARPFHGAKVALLIGADLLITLRDDIPAIDCPGLWDLPGGGREGGETPRQTALRETREEVGLDLAPAEWLWARAFPSATLKGTVSWLLVARLPAGAERGVAMGDEGQGWRLVPPEEFVAMDGAVPFLQDRVGVWLASLGAAAPGG
jgi:8-oxo-dGTP diphosphatase